jgi:hypothetical protein
VKILFFLIIAFLFATQQSFASNKCLEFFRGETAGFKAQNSSYSYIPKLFAEISVKKSVVLKNGETIQFQDQFSRDKSKLVSAFQGSGWRGVLEMSRENDQINLDVISLEGDRLVRFIDPVGQTPLIEGRGIPVSSYVSMRGIKLMGLTGVKTFKMAKIRHAETVVVIAREVKNR